MSSAKDRRVFLTMNGGVQGGRLGTQKGRYYRAHKAVRYDLVVARAYPIFDN